jgi:hypothetical protein
MSDLTRRGFVSTSAGAAAGLTALGALASEAEANADGHRGPVIAYVHDAKSGEIAVMCGDREVKVRDRALAARIARAAR